MNEIDLEHADLVEELAALTPIEWPPDEAGDRVTHSVLGCWSSQQGEAGRQPMGRRLAPRRRRAMRTRRFRLGALPGSCAALLVLTVVTLPTSTKPVTSEVRPSLTGVHVLGWGLYYPDHLAASGADLFVANLLGGSITILPT
jgi:hypothetical protein